MQLLRPRSALAVPSCVFAVLLAIAGGGTKAQEKRWSLVGADEQPLRMNVDEVVVTFHATDANGLPVSDLKAGDVRIRDNGVAPRRVVAFSELIDRPIRAGILLDASESMQGAFATDKKIAKEFIESLFRPRMDEAFVSSFGYGSDVLRAWSSDPIRLVQGIESAREYGDAHGGTALFNAVFRACSYSFDKVDPTATGSFILMFSDGQDNAGLTSLEEAARACQGSNTAVFAFLSTSSTGGGSSGPKALRELAAKTGGRVFRADDSAEEIARDLHEIDAEMRNQYRLVYKPFDLKHDGAFHEIELQPPDRVSHVEVRSGYFAPQH